MVGRGSWVLDNEATEEVTEREETEITEDTDLTQKHGDAELDFGFVLKTRATT
jgi:hypothetical protein